MSESLERYATGRQYEEQRWQKQKIRLDIVSVVRRLAVGPTGLTILPGIRTRNLLISTEPARGFEPRIFSLQVRCVTTAPYGQLKYMICNLTCKISVISTYPFYQYSYTSVTVTLVIIIIIFILIYHRKRVYLRTQTRQQLELNMMLDTTGRMTSKSQRGIQQADNMRNSSGKNKR